MSDSLTHVFLLPGGVANYSSAALRGERRRFYLSIFEPFTANAARAVMPIHGIAFD